MNTEFYPDAVSAGYEAVRHGQERGYLSQEDAALITQFIEEMRRLMS